MDRTRPFEIQRGEGLQVSAHHGTQSTGREPEYVDSMGGSSQGKVRCAPGHPQDTRSHTKFGTTEGGLR
eukprot:6972849-Prorocentrum_lima.AAC.1